MLSTPKTGRKALWFLTGFSSRCVDAFRSASLSPDMNMMPSLAAELRANGRVAGQRHKGSIKGLRAVIDTPELWVAVPKLLK